jgi:mRNA-degrading endonuclease toxin of MazEF toxin-antitoxin module
VIVSADELSTGSERDLFVVVPLSASSSQSPLRPVVAASTGISRSSVAVCSAVRSVSRGRLLRQLGQLDRATLTEVGFALSLVLGLE